MQVINDNRPEYIQRLEHLLYGYNYQVSLDVYGPLDSGAPLIDILKSAVNSSCVVSRCAPVSLNEVREQVLEWLLYPGDPGSGPKDLDIKHAEIRALAEQLLQGAQLDNADAAYDFYLANGHPGYPVFWEFAYDIHASGKRWILLGSSSD
ncbi:hypothetical protein [Pseudomonas yamanorum]